jgi:hypothetical protein
MWRKTLRKQKVEVYDAMARAARKRKAEDSSAELKEAFESLKAQGKTKDEEMKALKKIGRKKEEESDSDSEEEPPEIGKLPRV